MFPLSFRSSVLVSADVIGIEINCTHPRQPPKSMRHDRKKKIMRNILRITPKAILAQAFVVAMLLGTLNLPASAQTRIRFARGASSATVNGSLPGGYSRSYVVGARAGQMLTVRVRSAGNVWLDIGGNEVGTGITIECDSTDDYIITVNNSNNYAVNYSLFVAIN